MTIVARLPWRVGVSRRRLNGMYRREKRKLEVEIQRCRHHKRQFLPMAYMLMDRRMKLKSAARVRQKRHRHYE